LEEKTIEVHVPQMPDAAEPSIEKWVKHLAQVVGTPDEQTFFVGHSIGCQTLLRYCESLPAETRVGGMVLVAGFFTLTLGEDEDKNIAKPWLTRPINCTKVLSHTRNITAIFSDNDSYVPRENAKLFEERLHPKILMEHNRGHFSGSEGAFELPVAMKELMEMMSVVYHERA
jgi:uncharacterized protein